MAVGAGGTRWAELMEDAGPMRGYGGTTVEEPTDVADVDGDGDGVVDTDRDRAPDSVTCGDGGVGPYILG